MRWPTTLLVLARAIACAALLLGAAAASGEQQGGEPEPAAGDTPRPRVYRWIDENGISHYTTDPDRIPSRLRSAVGLPRPGETPPAPAPAQPSAGSSSNPLAMDRLPASPAAASAPTSDFEEGPPTSAAPASSAPQTSAPQRTDLDARIAALQAEIAADEEAIQAMISAAEPGPGALAADDPAFREIAQRLPKRLADLRTLEQERAQLGEP